jgi:hypothetical protein
LWERVKRLLDYLDEISLRVAVIVLVVIVMIVIFRAVAFVFLFFLVWLLSNEDIGSYPAIRRV